MSRIKVGDKVKLVGRIAKIKAKGYEYNYAVVTKIVHGFICFVDLMNKNNVLIRSFPLGASELEVVKKTKIFKIKKNVNNSTIGQVD